MASKSTVSVGTHYNAPGPYRIEDAHGDATTSVVPWNYPHGETMDKPFVYLGEHYGDTTDWSCRFGFFLVLHNEKTKVAKVHVGCRMYTYAQATKHWAGGQTKNGCSRPHHLALVKCAREIAKINGWKF